MQQKCLVGTIWCLEKGLINLTKHDEQVFIISQTTNYKLQRQQNKSHFSTMYLLSTLRLRRTVLITQLKLQNHPLTRTYTSKILCKYKPRNAGTRCNFWMECLNSVSVWHRGILSTDVAWFWMNHTFLNCFFGASRPEYDSSENLETNFFHPNYVSSPAPILPPAKMDKNYDIIF